LRERRTCLFYVVIFVLLFVFVADFYSYLFYFYFLGFIYYVLSSTDYPIIIEKKEKKDKDKAWEEEMKELCTSLVLSVKEREVVNEMLLFYAFCCMEMV
jgi:hypothetical protein